MENCALMRCLRSDTQAFFGQAPPGWPGSQTLTD